MSRPRHLLVLLLAAAVIAGCAGPSGSDDGSSDGPGVGGESGDGASGGGLGAGSERSGGSGAGRARTSADAIEAFRAAGLDVGEIRPMAPKDYGPAPLTAREGTRFFIASLCEGEPGPCEKGGRAMSFENEEDKAAVRHYYEELGRASALFFSWVFEKDNLLVQINGDLPEEEARRYEAALQAIGAQ